MYISNYIKSFSAFFNQPVVKESVKNGIGITTFALGIFQVYRSVLGEPKPCSYTTTQKVIHVMAQISSITSAIGTRPGLAISRWVVKHIFTDEQLLQYFGPNLNFATTPFHARHVLSILSFAMGIPATVMTIRNWVWVKPDERSWVGSEEYMATWNTVTSRPMLHMVNALFNLS